MQQELEEEHLEGASGCNELRQDEVGINVQHECRYAAETSSVCRSYN